MADLQQVLSTRFERALDSLFGSSAEGVPLGVEPARNAQFGDYQFNGAMPLAKILGRKPRDIANDIVGAVELEDLCTAVDIAGPGFINLRLADRYLEATLSDMGRDPRLGLPEPDSPRTVVVDYSSPNVAKEMHVGHLRSSVIGDAIARVLGCLGHEVVRQNHVGDWGTQFGMLIEHLLETGWDGTGDHRVADLDSLYREAKRRDDTDPGFAERARRRVVALQRGDPQTRGVWEALFEESKRHFNNAYRRLGLLLVDEDIRGESFYNDRLPAVVEDLTRLGLVVESQGAKVIPLEGFTDADGNPVPMLVQKRDGGYLYSTTDLAAARYRIETLGADELVYVVDVRQSDHFSMLFQALRRAGWAPPRVRLEHVGFGMVLGEDRKPFRTREGGTVKLSTLLDTAVERAAAVLREKGSDLPPESQQEVAEAVGIGALKYADLSNDRRKDYVFSWDRMLALEGNTAPYLLNAYVRIRSIFRKAAVGFEEAAEAPCTLTEPAERELALRLLRLPETVRGVGDSLEVHRLCNYLYDTASTFHRFYEQCPVLVAPTAEQRAGRLSLCRTAALVLARGLELLGIRTVERM